MDHNEEIINNLLLELKRGTLVFSVLLAIKDPIYGYSLVTELQEKGIPIEQNTLYPLLRRLEKQGLLESSWDTSENRPRKYYQVSQAGKEITQQLKTEWTKLNEVISHLMKGDQS